MLNYERSGFWLVLGARFVIVSCGLCIPVLPCRMLNTGVHDACEQRDVVSASEVYESSSGCNAGVGGTVMGTGHEVHALESPELSCLFVKSQPHPWAFFSSSYFSMCVLRISEWVMSVKPCVPEGHGKQHPGASQPCWSGCPSLLAAPGPGFHAEKSHSSAASPAASQLPALAVSWC